MMGSPEAINPRRRFAPPREHRNADAAVLLTPGFWLLAPN